MNVRKFIAVTAREALRKVKETLGPDAIILSNRGVPGGVEIMAVAARDMAMIVPTPGREEVAQSDDYSVSLSSAAPVRAVPPPAAPLRAQPAPPRRRPGRSPRRLHGPCRRWRRARHRASRCRVRRPSAPRKSRRKWCRPV